MYLYYPIRLDMTSEEKYKIKGIGNTFSNPPKRKMTRRFTI
jgi:hypothetical protein